MLRAALSVCGRVVVADSHLACFQKLSNDEQNADLDSGFLDEETNEFISEHDRSEFYQKELYMIRHGETAGCEDPDPDLSEHAVDAITAAANILRGQNLCAFEAITSPLLRCLRTATILQQILGIKFRIAPEVMECSSNFYHLDTFRLKNRASSFPQFDWPTSKEWHLLPETQHDFYARVKETLRHIPAKSIVVTHYGYINLTTKLSLTKRVLDEGFPHASVTYFKGSDVKRLGCTNEEVL